MRMKVVALGSAILLSATASFAQAPSTTTNPIVRVSTPKRGTSIVEVVDTTVSIRKELSSLSSKLTISTPHGEMLRITVTPSGVLISDGHRVFRGSSLRPVSSDQAVSLIRTSPAALAARAVLSTLTLDPKTPAGNVLLLTKALLDASDGKVAAVIDHQRWARATASAPRVVRVSDTEEGPAECWNEYSRYAVEIFDDYLNCMREIQWWDLFGEYRCDAVYILRAELAFTWLINCSGPFPWK